MNELEKAIFDELAAAVSFQDFFNKISILQFSFNKSELKSLIKVIKHDAFVKKYGWETLCYMNDNIHKEKALPLNNISEKVRVRNILSDFEKDKE